MSVMMTSPRSGLPQCRGLNSCIRCQEAVDRSPEGDLKHASRDLLWSRRLRDQGSRGNNAEARLSRSLDR